MLKLIFIFLIPFLVPFVSHGFTYLETPAFDKPSGFEIASFSQKIKKSGFHTLDQSGLGNIPFLKVDQIFAKNQSAVFLKLGLKVSDEKILGSILPHEKGFIFHGLSDAKTPYALFFYQMSQSEAEFVLSSAQISFQKKTASKLDIIYQLIALPVQAQSPAQCQQKVDAAQLLRQAVLPQKVIGEIMLSCAVSALRGAVDGVKGMGESLKNLFTDPRKLWDDVVEQYEQVKDFVLNIGPRMTQMFETMKSLDAETMAEIACSTVSSILIQAIIGGGIAKAAVMVATKIASLSKISRALEAIGRVKRANGDSPGAKKLVSDVVACAK